MKIVKIVSISLLFLILMGCCGYLFTKNMKLNKSYEAATQQVTQLQAKLDAVGTFADVWTVKTNVGMGGEIKDADLTLQTIPSSSVPTNVVTDKSTLLGKYYRIGFGPGQTITSDLVMSEEFTGAVYDRDVFLDSMPVGTQVGDYIDIRLVLPGGEEFVVFPHKRVNARYENATKLRFDESDLWLYTSMMADRALYKAVGLKIYATKYVDPGRDDKVVAYYPVRREVVDIMNISANLTDRQRADMWNESLRKSIDTKLKFYADDLNQDSGKLAAGVQDEEGRYSTAEEYYQSIIDTLTNDPANNNGLVDPNNPNAGDTGSVGNTGTSDSGTGGTAGNTNSGTGGTTSDGTTPVGNLNDGSAEAPTADGQTDASGNGNVIKSQDYLNNLGDDMFGDEDPIR